MRRVLRFGWLIVVMDWRDWLGIVLIWFSMVSFEELRGESGKKVHLISRLLLSEDIRRQHNIPTGFVSAFGLDFNFLEDLFVLDDVSETIIFINRSLLTSTSLVRHYLLCNLMIIWLNLRQEMGRFLLNYDRSRWGMVTWIGLALFDGTFWWRIVYYASSTDVILFLFIMRIFIFNYLLLCYPSLLLYRNILFEKNIKLFQYYLNCLADKWWKVNWCRGIWRSPLFRKTPAEYHI